MKTPHPPLSLPAISVAALRKHFMTTYQLNEEQVEIMIRSSQRSLEVTLGQARNHLNEGAALNQLGDVFHNLKGLLLNMGQTECAAAAVAAEHSAKAGKNIGYKEVIDSLDEAAVEIITYDKDS